MSQEQVLRLHSSLLFFTTGLISSSALQHKALLVNSSMPTMWLCTPTPLPILINCERVPWQEHSLLQLVLSQATSGPVLVMGVCQEHAQAAVCLQPPRTGRTQFTGTEAGCPTPVGFNGWEHSQAGLIQWYKPRLSPLTKL